MRLARRILITIGVTLVALIVLVDFIVPDALCSYLKKTAPASVYAVPIDLQDLSVSQAPGMKMRYFGYEFEVPWSDVEEAERKPFATKNSGWDSACVSFRSGLKLFIVADPPDEASSDYALAKLLYEFSPSKIRIWPPSPRTQYRQLVLFMSKSEILSHIPSTPAESGIFNLRGRNFRGFQLGNPRVRPDWLRLELYSDDGRFEITFMQGGYEEPAGVTQPEINRIVESLHRVEANEGGNPALSQLN
jgi:hypothetical protein